MARTSFLRNYALSLVLIASVVIGSVLGLLLGPKAACLKPFGQVFLNALFTLAVPLVFFSISAAVASMASTGRLLRILGWMMVVFIVTGIISSSLMVAAVRAYPPAQGVTNPEGEKADQAKVEPAQQIVSALTVPDFVDLLSKRHILALILFAVVVGLAASSLGEKGRPFTVFLVSASDVFVKIISYVMYYAPIGLAAYFAYLVGAFGPRLLGSYLRAMVVYYPVCIAYFVIAFTVYAYVAGRSRGVRTFWANILPPSLVALGTGSSYATIPSNLLAADRVGVPRQISELVIPIGATIHMDGSCLSAILKIAFLFGFYHRPFEGFETIATAIGIALLSGTVMSGIPNGGFTGEILIVALYGFPAEALPIVSMIGTLVDPPATMVNAVGDNVASMVVARITGGRDWMKGTASARA